MGDPLGVGAEIIVKSLALHNLTSQANFIIFGLASQLRDTACALNVDFDFTIAQNASNADLSKSICVVDYPQHEMPEDLKHAPSRIGGKASLDFYSDLISAAQDKIVDAIVTAPISKTSWIKAGQRKFPGHTEMLAYRCRSRKYAMMFVAPKLKIVLATIHDQLMSLRNKITIGTVYNPIELAHEMLKNQLGIAKPKIGVAGLNPHAGESGNIGDEEYRIISPAIQLANDAGMNVVGPIPADTIFNRAIAGEFDCVVAMYHDQGMIPIKLLAWDDAVNTTIGLPIIRTSPDHGTAFDIASKFIASESSMKAAIILAIDLANKSSAEIEI